MARLDDPLGPASRDRGTAPLRGKRRDLATYCLGDVGGGVPRRGAISLARGGVERGPTRLRGDSRSEDRDRASPLWSPTRGATGPARQTHCKSGWARRYTSANAPSARRRPCAGVQPRSPAASPPGWSLAFQSRRLTSPRRGGSSALDEKRLFADLDTAGLVPSGGAVRT